MAIQSILEISPKNRRVLAQIVNSPNATKRGIRNAFYLIGKELTKQSRDLIKNPPKTGRIYKLKGRKKRHRASAPGQAPANRRGTLRRNVGFQVNGDIEMDFGVRPLVDYGKFLELGTAKMKKREFLIRAINEKRKDTENYFNGNLNKNLSKLP